MMTADQRAKYAQKLIDELASMPNVSYSNYKDVLAEYKRIANDFGVLIRDDALEEAGKT